MDWRRDWIPTRDWLPSWSRTREWLPDWSRARARAREWRPDWSRAREWRPSWPRARDWRPSWPRARGWLPTWARRRRPEPWKGLVAGAAGGVAGTLAMTAFQVSWSAAKKRVERSRGSSRASLGQEPGEHIARYASHRHHLHEEPASRGVASHGNGGSATTKAATRVSEGLFHHELSPRAAEIAGSAVHFGFGTTVGAVYGLAAEMAPAVAIGAGAPFGLAVMLVADEMAVPALGLSESPVETPMETHAMSLGAHLVYGVVCEATRCAVREVLD